MQLCMCMLCYGIYNASVHDDIGANAFYVCRLSYTWKLYHLLRFSFLSTTEHSRDFEVLDLQRTHCVSPLPKSIVQVVIVVYRFTDSAEMPLK